jgi:hypothetical protein
LLKHHIPVKTDRWNVQRPGFVEVDLAAHSRTGGGRVRPYPEPDRHLQRLDRVPALLGKSEIAVQRALGQMQASLPFRLLGVDADNGGEFIHWHLKRWCDAQQIQLTRGRPYKKDDSAHIEQKN